MNLALGIRNEWISIKALPFEDVSYRRFLSLCCVAQDLCFWEPELVCRPNHVTIGKAGEPHKSPCGANSWGTETTLSSRESVSLMSRTHTSLPGHHPQASLARWPFWSQKLILGGKLPFLSLPLISYFNLRMWDWCSFPSGNLIQKGNSDSTNTCLN